MSDESNESTVSEAPVQQLTEAEKKQIAAQRKLEAAKKEHDKKEKEKEEKKAAGYKEREAQVMASECHNPEGIKKHNWIDGTSKIRGQSYKKCSACNDIVYIYPKKKALQ